MVKYSTLRKHYKFFKLIRDMSETLWDIPYSNDWTRQYIFFDFYPYYWHGWSHYFVYGNGPYDLKQFVDHFYDDIDKLRSNKWQRDIMDKFIAYSDSKLLEFNYTNSEVRSRGDNIKYFRLKRYFFNYFKLTQTEWLDSKGRPRSTYMNFTLALLGGEPDTLIRKDKILFSGWVNNKSDLRRLWRIYRNAYNG